MLGNLHVRFGGGDPETYRGNVARRRVSTLPYTSCVARSLPSATVHRVRPWPRLLLDEPLHGRTPCRAAPEDAFFPLTFANTCRFKEFVPEASSATHLIRSIAAYVSVRPCSWLWMSFFTSRGGKRHMRSLLTIREIWALSRYPRQKPSRSTQIAVNKRGRAFWQRFTKSTRLPVPNADPK